MMMSSNMVTERQCDRPAAFVVVGGAARKFQSLLWPPLAISGFPTAVFNRNWSDFFNSFYSSVTHKVLKSTKTVSLHRHVFIFFIFFMIFCLFRCCAQGNAQVQQSCLTLVQGSSCPQLLITGWNNSPSRSRDFLLKCARIWLACSQLCRETPQWNTLGRIWTRHRRAGFCSFPLLAQRSVKQTQDLWTGFS